MKYKRTALLSLFIVIPVLALGGLALFRGRDPDRRFFQTSGQPRLIEQNHWMIPVPAKAGYFSSMERVNRDIMLKPTIDEQDRLKELRIARLEVESPIYAAGFRKDDRILLVNGRPVDTLSRAINLAHEVQASTRLRVRVERDGKVIDYSFDFE